MTLLCPLFKNFCSIIPSLFEMPHFLASVWMCIHSSRMGAYYTLSEAVTAAFSEEAKTLHSSDNVPRQTHKHIYTACTRRSNYTRAHWHNAHRRDERANLSNHQQRQAWGRIVTALVWRKRAECSCVCNFDFSFFLWLDSTAFHHYLQLCLFFPN